MEIILDLNVKQSVSCCCMTHQFYISLKFCVQLTGDVNKMISSCSVGTSECSVGSTGCISVFLLDIFLTRHNKYRNFEIVGLWTLSIHQYFKEPHLRTETDKAVEN